MRAPRCRTGTSDPGDSFYVIEEHYQETTVARAAAREKQQQQHFRPVIGVHKWFARRPGTLFRALVLAELGNTPGTVLDPFMGGGTAMLEAARLGHDIIGYDTNPMAWWIVSRELDDVDSAELAEAGARVIAAARRQLEEFYRTACETCREEVDARYHLWVRHRLCSCGREHPLLADTLLVSTGLARHPLEVHICSSCMQLSEHSPGGRSELCPHCRERFDAQIAPANRQMECECGEVWRVPPRGELHGPLLKLAAVQYHCDRCHDPIQRAFKTADIGDSGRVNRAADVAATLDSKYWPDELIPAGEETRRLHRWGYLRWRDLFGERQLIALHTIADCIAAEAPGAVQDALQTCLSDTLRFHNHLVRYDRQALKPTDVFAVHGFPVPRVVCEPHPLGDPGVGSGGFAHMLAKYVRAKRWCAEPYETEVSSNGRLTRRHFSSERLPTPGAQVRLQNRSMNTDPHPPAAGTVSMVLTDPPYYANVHYAQLTDFHYHWLARMTRHPGLQAGSSASEHDAVGSETVDLAEFASRLSAVYVAAARSLKPGGPFAFTYHHNQAEAYAPVAMACLDAGLLPVRAYACPTEMRASKHIHGRDAATVDAVFVLRKPPLPSSIPEQRFGPHWTGARLRALRRSGVTVTDADHACLNHARHCLLAIRELSAGWDLSLPTEERLLRCLEEMAPQVTVS